MTTVPDAPESVDAAVLATLLNLKTPEDAERVLQLAIVTFNRALSGAFRSMDQETYDDCIRRVAGAIVGVGKRPVNTGNGQLTTTQQDAPQQGPRDYLTPVRATLALYVVPL